jgi:hypothetical protein
VFLQTNSDIKRIPPFISEAKSALALSASKPPPKTKRKSTNKGNCGDNPSKKQNIAEKSSLDNRTKTPPQRPSRSASLNSSTSDLSTTSSSSTSTSKKTKLPAVSANKQEELPLKSKHTNDTGKETRQNNEDKGEEEANKKLPLLLTGSDKTSVACECPTTTSSEKTLDKTNIQSIITDIIKKEINRVNSTEEAAPVLIKPETTTAESANNKRKLDIDLNEDHLANQLNTPSTSSYSASSSTSTYSNKSPVLKGQRCLVDETSKIVPSDGARVAESESDEDEDRGEFPESLEELLKAQWSLGAGLIGEQSKSFGGRKFFSIINTLGLLKITNEFRIYFSVTKNIPKILKMF